MAEEDLPCQTSSLPLQQQFEVPGHLCKQLQSHPTDTPKRTVQTAMGPPRQPLTPPNPPSSPAPCRPKPWIPAASTRKYGNILPTRSGDSQTSVYVGGCQNYGLFLGPYNTAPIMYGTQKGTLILTRVRPFLCCIRCILHGVLASG